MSDDVRQCIADAVHQLLYNKLGAWQKRAYDGTLGGGTMGLLALDGLAGCSKTETMATSTVALMLLQYEVFHRVALRD